MCAASVRVLLQSPVRAVDVVVADVLTQDQPQVLFVQRAASGRGRHGHPGWQAADPDAPRAPRRTVRGAFKGPDIPDYRLETAYPDGTVPEVDDPFRFWPALRPLDLHLLAGGRHEGLRRRLGAQVRVPAIDGPGSRSWRRAVLPRRGYEG